MCWPFPRGATGAPWIQLPGWTTLALSHTGSNWKSWLEVPGWHIGPELHHLRCLGYLHCRLLPTWPLVCILSSMALPFMDSTRILRTLQSTKLFFVKQEMNLIRLITCLIYKSTFHFCPCQSHCPWHPWITFSTCVLWLYFSFKFHDLHLVLYMASDFTPHYSPSVGLRQRKLLKNTTKGKKNTTAERIMS